MPQLYTLDASIAEFFETNGSITTREECDAIARSLVGAPVLPVPIQGSWSYTVTAGEAQTKIVQFRARESKLDMQMFEEARKTHREFVPAIEYHGDTGGSTPLSIYLTDLIPGVPYIIAPSDKNSDHLRLNTIRDFSRFFVQAWKSPLSLPDADLNDIKLQLEQKLNILYTHLPARFIPTVDRLRGRLPLLFTPDYPIVLTHGDLCALNILVDPKSLHITGLIDWAEAEIAPFGVALYGIFNILGVMDSEGWHYHANYTQMVAHFWITFEQEAGPLSKTRRDAIRAACMIGILLQNGFTWNGQDKQTPAKEGDDSMRYLDAWIGVDRPVNDLLLSL